MGDFERETRVEGGGGRYRAALSQDWEIWGPNGGYLAAIALRAEPRIDAEWLLADAEAPIGKAGLIGGATRIWTPDGRLVASGGAQLICVAQQRR